MLLIVQEHYERLAHLALERRLPTESRLAIAWLERFEAYYRIWTPVSGVGNDLSAYRATLLEGDRPYDRPPGTEGPDDPGYTQERQAEGYITVAVWHYTNVLCGVKQLMDRYGGMWLLSDAKAEEALAQAVYGLNWHNPNNERDDSYLRLAWDKAKGELDHFLRLASKDPTLAAILSEWTDWASGCSCIWDVNHEVDTEHFPTYRHHPDIKKGCPLHDLVRACNDYCTLIDDDWQRIADWYELPGDAPRPANDRKMYESGKQAN